MALSHNSDVTETMSDEELVKLAREGREEELSLLFRRFTSLVRRQAASLPSRQMEAEDLVQEGMMGLLSAVRTYESGSASFRTYASVCVRNRILSAVKRSAAARRVPVSDFVRTDDDPDSALELPGEQADPAQLVVQKEEDRRLEGRLRRLLSPKEYTVLMLYLQAYAYQEIAAAMRMSAKAVDNALQRARRKLVSSSFFGN